MAGWVRTHESTGWHVGGNDDRAVRKEGAVMTKFIVKCRDRLWDDLVTGRSVIEDLPLLTPSLLHQRTHKKNSVCNHPINCHEPFTCNNGREITDLFPQFHCCRWPARAVVRWATQRRLFRCYYGRSCLGQRMAPPLERCCQQEQKLISFTQPDKRKFTEFLFTDVHGCCLHRFKTVFLESRI